MNIYIKKFLLRGLIFGGFGPIVMAIVYLALSLAIDDFTLGGKEIFIATVSTYLLAFIHAGASVFNQIEHWQPLKSILFHFAILYFAYTGCYFINSWIPFNLIGFLSFTLGFILIYVVIATIVIISIKTIEKRLNEKLK